MTNFFLSKDRLGDAPIPHTNIHAMVDIETMSTAPGAPVLTIGVVLFDPTMSDSIEVMERRALLIRVDVEDAVRHSTGVDGGTLKWWLGQKDEVIKELVSGRTETLANSLTAFHRYCLSRSSTTDREFFEGHSTYPTASMIWAKSPDFDCKILEHAYAQVGGYMPFRYYQYRCVRTVQDLAWPCDEDRPVFAGGALHDARADAIAQALTVQAAYRQLGLARDQDVKYGTFTDHHQ